MHIAIYHDAVIPPIQYGGTERVIKWLANALILLGHKVTLLARPGSAITGANILYDVLYIDNKHGWQNLISNDVDIIHLFLTPHEHVKKPFLVTIQGNGKEGELFHRNTVFISRKHAENHGTTHFVYNGLDPAEFQSNQTREDYLVFLAKASWKVKNLLGALEIARIAQKRLIVMGDRKLPLGADSIKRFFGKIRNVEYLGMVNDHEKNHFLKKAHGLLFPVRWHEPFGIAILEALASGCPIFGTPYGSLPEIITSDVGYLETKASSLAEKINQRLFEPSVCSNRVITGGFTHIDMAKAYIRYYNRILNFGVLGVTIPQTMQKFDKLLPWN
ncbi:MAG: glycosyltransferase [Candidatus Poribacteria bacterium]